MQEYIPEGSSGFSYFMRWCIKKLLFNWIVFNFVEVDWGGLRWIEVPITNTKQLDHCCGTKIKLASWHGHLLCTLKIHNVKFRLTCIDYSFKYHYKYIKIQTSNDGYYPPHSTLVFQEETENERVSDPDVTTEYEVHHSDSTQHPPPLSDHGNHHVVQQDLPFNRCNSCESFVL